ncbi:MAG: glucose-1-phosphate cytidylyltransferase [Parcubacteria group bacterium]|nr:glucose-1-phosphate cytidylyltransferase [Parcubacteria group bacterium]|tara:strand:- start:3006 stop:3776 length:771 start_codon:yes stop_codon:yes gene_type:complete
MKVVILAGGLGTRISEETQVRPKPMVEIGGMPILWHIMKMYSHFGFNEFIICLGYKGEVIKEWFAHQHLRESDVTFDFSNDTIVYHSPAKDHWKVTLVDTGKDTLTAGRLSRIREYVGEEQFMMTYGDGVSDINIKDLLKHHKLNGRIATVTTVVPEGRFGVVEIDSEHGVSAFSEKTDNQKRVNGGFFVFEPKIFEYLNEGDLVALEQEPLRKLAADSELVSYPHDGFWKSMDTLSDKNKLETLWRSEKPWKLWD